MQNGYSIAEILLVFGIIAGVLVGVWAMYTLLGDNSDVQAVIAEVQMLQSAAVTYKNASETNSYSMLGPDVISALRPYLGGSGLSDGQNIFGEMIVILPSFPDGKNFVIFYAGVSSMEICRRVLERFGEVTHHVLENAFTIEAGKTISGYVGGSSFGTGCAPSGYLYITID